jgi:hypothetical protein
MASRPTNQHPQASQLRFYSVGVVANNKPMSSDEVEVTPIEHLPFVDGQLTDAGTPVQAQGTDNAGGQYSTQVASSVTIKATWLKLGQGNRKTSPDIRRGAQVALYQFGDADTYYWTTMLDDSSLRKLETVVWAFSGTSDESKSTDADSSYYIEISTHTGMITLHTSKANGEPYGYDIQLNTKEGYFRMQDDIGNYALLDSTQNHFEFGNGDQSVLQILKQQMALTTQDSIALKTKRFSLDTQTATINSNTFGIKATTTHTGDFTENGALGLNGDMTTKAGGGEGSTAGTGKITIAGQTELLGDMDVKGGVSAVTIAATASITAPNLRYN